MSGLTERQLTDDARLARSDAKGCMMKSPLMPNEESPGTGKELMAAWWPPQLRSPGELE